VIDRTNPDDVYEPNNNAYTQAISATGTRQVFVAGTVPKNEAGELVGVGSMKRQVEKTLDNLERSLAAQDATPSDVVRIRIFVTDMDAYLREAYPDWPESRGRADVDTPSLVQQFFGGDSLPTSTLVGVTTLTDSFTGVAPGEPTDVEPHYLVEVDVTAVVED
jgi:enamine deaminase RidA (YjgF/YER057c/UK114 family)